MAPNKKKTKADLEDAIFRFVDKLEELDEYFQDSPESSRLRKFNVGVVKEVLGELLGKWEQVAANYMTFVRSRDSEEEEEKTELEEFGET